MLKSIALPAAAVERIATPALLVYLDRVRSNCELIVQRYCGGDASRWRPHVKTSKLESVYTIAAECGVRHFKCATTLEARVLATSLRELGVAGESDILVAYPLVGPSLRELGEIQREFANLPFSVVVEDTAAVADVPAPLGIFLDVNPGMDRTGMTLHVAEQGGAAAVARAAGDRFRGLHAYDGHAANWAYVDERRDAMDVVYDRVRALVEVLHADGVACGEVITSGTPSFISALAHAGLGAMRDEVGTVHRVSPGTVMLSDARTGEQLGDVGLEPAAFVLARCVSKPAPNRITLDAGCKAISADAGNPIANVVGYEASLTALGPSEEHLPLALLDASVGEGGGADGEESAAGAARAIARGDALYLLPRHICPSVNMFTEAILVEEGEELRVVPVDARGHAPQRM